MHSKVNYRMRESSRNKKNVFKRLESNGKGDKDLITNSAVFALFSCTYNEKIFKRDKDRCRCKQIGSAHKNSYENRFMDENRTTPFLKV